MKKLLIVLTSISLTAMLLAYTDEPGLEGAYAVITRITTSETRSLDALPNDPNDTGFDVGETSTLITESFGGSPFITGHTTEIIVALSAPPTNAVWGLVKVQYFYGTNTMSSTNWITIASRTNPIRSRMSFECRLPSAGDYLFRVYAYTDTASENGDLEATNITAKGDDISWHNAEVVGFTLTDNNRPGVSY